MPRKPSKTSWGGRGGRSGNFDDKHYFAHDDRVPRNDGSLYLGNRPRVSFKTQARPARDVPRGLALACLDEDVQMATSSNNNNRQVIMTGRNRGIQRGRNSPVPHRRFRMGLAPRIRQFPIGDSNWYKITIPYGHKYDKDYIINNLLSYIAPETFIPFMYKVVGNEATFYVDDNKIAMALADSDRKITTTDGFKLQVRVSKAGFPQCEIDNKLKERLKQAMAKRYVHETNALDLSRFHRDPDLITDYFCALFRPVMLKAVLDIVSEHIPDLEALNLDGNKLQLIEKLNVLDKKFTKLKILYLGDNKIKDINQIDTIKDLKLEELKLEGNPVCNKYKSRQNDYISDVRKRFPKLLRLDGMELPKPILFDVADEGNKMPPSQRMFVANAKAQEIASQFLQQYFLIFDSENRQPLLDAYVEHACFSMTMSYTHSTNKLNGYLMENRNLYRINDTNKRQKLLKQGRLPVVSFISEMPQTSHYLNTFTMDISLITDGMMLTTVTGLFKELDKKEQPIRYFNRTFIIVPEGSGYCIRNEQLHISQPTDAQLRQLNNQNSETQITNPGSYTPSSSGTAKSLSVQLPEDVKQQMTMTLSQQTNMNLEWSLKCLEEVLWNYDNALSAFQEFYKRGQIPAEAFNK
ncbi:nuclear RNA export factor 1 [Apis mellifera caucasica]|uniref:Nuclear RNA export factor 1 n=1 Tax=Apis mellifera TaxID=7460 RepID=A0A7M7R6S9_APIME|nr:nuclear RNA export factor 1 [Apis mellifera]KAG6797302.1 nuclear RNA export factor 1 [Apis mellifera caucasica]|eukprot:XP_397092.3 nuclear RNA export factor 1 [Apis mellifera]